LQRNWNKHNQYRLQHLQLLINVANDLKKSTVYDNSGLPIKEKIVAAITFYYPASG